MQFTIEKPFITYELASALTQSAITHAKTLQIAICVAIVDPVGNLVSFSKMDECDLIGISTSQGKAYTAAMSGLNTRDFLSYLHENEVPLTRVRSNSKCNILFICENVVWEKNTSRSHSVIGR